MGSPLCEIKNGAAAYVPAAGGVNVTPGNVIVIRLMSLADIGSWSISCATSDELSSVAAINASLVIDSTLYTATFTIPANTGRALRFQSRVNGGKNANGNFDSSYTTTFCLYTLVAGNRVHALDETTEGNALAGWGGDVNALIRAGGGGGTTPTGTGFPHITSGSQDVAARAVALGTADVSGVLPPANGGTGVTSLTVPTSGELVGESDPATLTGKSMSGVANTFSGIPGSAVVSDFGAQSIKTTGALLLASIPTALVSGSGLYIGTDAAFATQAANISVYAGTAVGLGIGGSTYQYLTGGYVESWKPRIGSATASSPYGSDGVGDVAMADANQTAPASAYRFGTIRTTDAATADRTLTLPAAPDSGAYYQDLDNTCTGLFGVILTTGAGVTFRVNNGTRCRVRVASDGVTPASSPLWYGASTNAPGTSAVGGTNCTATGANAFCYGYGSSADGDGGTAIGYSCHAAQTYSVCVGSYSTASGAGSVCLGETLTASGSNSVAIGYASSATGDYSAAIGCYNTASGSGSCALGISANAVRPGALGHGSGCGPCQGLHALDMYRELAGVAGDLQDRQAGPLILDTLSLCSMRVRIIAAKTAGAAKAASEVHELVVNVQAGGLTIVSDTTISGSGTIAAQGWSVTISSPGSNELRFACNPGADTVRFFARVEWAQIGNL